jgi:DNA-binding XRE family transcriptional regulator
MSALAQALQAQASTAVAFSTIAQRARVTPRQVALARSGKPINAGAFLALCGTVGLDPVDGAARPIKSVSPNIVWWLMSAALYITRGLRRLDQRSAAKAIGVSASTVCRVEAGKPISVGAMIKVCTFIGVHPDGYTAPPNSLCLAVSRETPTETRCSDSDIDNGSATHA